MSTSREELTGQPSEMRGPLDMVRNIISTESGSATNEAALVSRSEVASVFEPDDSTRAAGMVEIRRLLEGTAAASIPDFEVESAFYARKGDTERAAALLESFIGWRQRVGDGNPVSCPKVMELLREGLTISLGTRDRDGRAIVYNRLCKLDSARFDALTVLRTISFVFLYTIRTFPWARTHGVTLMQDMNGVQLRKLDSRIPGEMRKAFSQTLPVRVANMLVLSPPSWIRLIFSVVAKFMGSKLKARLRMIPDTQSLLEIADPDQVPALANLGGTFEWSEAQHMAWVSQLSEDCRSWPGIDLSPVTEQMRSASPDN